MVAFSSRERYRKKTGAGIRPHLITRKSARPVLLAPTTGKNLERSGTNMLDSSLIKSQSAECVSLSASLRYSPIRSHQIYEGLLNSKAFACEHAPFSFRISALPHDLLWVEGYREFVKGVGQGLPLWKLPNGSSSVTPRSIDRSAAPSSVQSFVEVLGVSLAAVSLSSQLSGNQIMQYKLYRNKCQYSGFLPNFGARFVISNRKREYWHYHPGITMEFNMNVSWTDKGRQVQAHQPRLPPIAPAAVVIQFHQPTALPSPRPGRRWAERSVIPGCHGFDSAAWEFLISP
ncbi:uncharacterized protein CLUP02_10774 [Colletotrichum lupini]|uniref:Uncharacterized protein n=1 Tax=Colletotrichum lupini TaxID=145971 RepID=A0A9Q8SZ39_9PEZI|nr:uncharacterized protein CLUP02_10774 [Colletotrichum lupini]UQC85277.1 hypothetical protein CLUP02_10774 [Colletotrichum lupini]